MNIGDRIRVKNTGRKGEVIYKLKDRHLNLCVMDFAGTEVGAHFERYADDRLELESPPVPPRVFELPPKLTAPTTVQVPPGVNQALTLDKAKDYILTGNGAGGLKIYGGRNIVWRGTRMKIDYVGDYSAFGGNAKLWQRARFGPNFEDFTGTVFVEDFRLSGNDVSEGIDANTSAPNTRFVLQDFRIGPVTSRAIVKWVDGRPTLNPSFGGEPYPPLTRLASGKFWDNHPDAFQSWSMPTEIVLCHGTVVTSCQANFLEGPHNSRVLFRRVNIRPMEFAGTRFIDQVLNKGNTGNPDFELRLDDVWCEPTPQRGTDRSAYTATYSGSSGWEADLRLGVPPGGDFVV